MLKLKSNQEINYKKIKIKIKKPNQKKMVAVAQSYMVLWSYVHAIWTSNFKALKKLCTTACSNGFAGFENCEN